MAHPLPVFQLEYKKTYIISKLNGLELEFSLMIRKHATILTYVAYHRIMDLIIKIVKESYFMKVRVCSVVPWNKSSHEECRMASNLKCEKSELKVFVLQSIGINYTYY